MLVLYLFYVKCSFYLLLVRGALIRRHKGSLSELLNGPGAVSIEAYAADLLILRVCGSFFLLLAIYSNVE